jgi:REP element-mobilizing transposase RayT
MDSDKQSSKLNSSPKASRASFLRRKHLQRLDTIFEAWRGQIFFITVCVRHRQKALSDTKVADILIRAWKDALDIHGWAIGRYVIMPDHLHFFAAQSSEHSKDLSGFVGGWKYHTQARIRKEVLSSFAWQKEFFDHLLRSDESYTEKWEYVRNNPVRAGLVSEHEDWPYQGEIHCLER